MTLSIILDEVNLSWNPPPSLKMKKNTILGQK